MAQNEAELAVPQEAATVEGPRSQPASYCQVLVRTHDPDLYYASRYASEPQQHHMIALAAWQIELRQLVGQVTTPPLGEIRLQWWRDAFDEIINEKGARSHPVVLSMAGVVKDLRGDERRLEPLKNGIENAITARARLLYDAPFGDEEDFLDWAMQAEGGVLAALNIPTKELSESENRKKEGDHHLITLYALGVMARDGMRLAPALEYTSLQAFCINKCAEIKKGLLPITSEEVAFWLPATLINYYGKRKHTRPATVRRHLVYLRTVISGKL